MSNQFVEEGQQNGDQTTPLSLFDHRTAIQPIDPPAKSEQVLPLPEEPNNQGLIELNYLSIKSTPEIARKHIAETIDHLTKEIVTGHVVVRDSAVPQQSSDRSDEKGEQRRKQREQLEKQLDLLNQQLTEHKKIEQKQRVQKLLKRREERASTDIQHKALIDRKLEQWREDRKIQQMRKALFDKKQRQRDEKIRIEEQQRKEEHARKTSEERKKHFEEYMKSLEKRREDRLKHLSRKLPVLSRSATKPLLQPEQIVIITQPKVDFEQIKHHQKAYMEKVRERSPKSSSVVVQHPSQFHLLDRREVPPILIQSEIVREKVKAKRRHDFDTQVARNIPISVDSEKRKQSEIAIDKEKNKMKYLILSRKGLTDEQIFSYKDREFKHGIVHNPREVGNVYLQQVKGEVRRNLSEKSVSVKSVPANFTVTTKSPPRYTNYLETGKRPRLDQMQRLLQQARNKPQALMLKSQEYEGQVLKEIRQFSKKKDTRSYSESIETQSRIDDLYLKALKAKVACVTIAK